MEIRTLEELDIPKVVEAWNQSLIYDQITRERFERVVLKDPNYEKEGSILALDRSKIVGLVIAVAREGISGKDNRGRPEEKDNGYIKGFFLLDDYWDTGIGERLLDEATGYLRSKGKSLIKVVVYTGRYFFPGIDTRYKRLLRFFDENSFERVHIIDDVAVNLRDFEPTEYHREARRRIAEIGVEITTYRPEMLGKMREYVKKLNMKQWFPKGWEKGFGEKGHTLVALKGEEIVGWANYWPSKECGGFGPIGVLREFRGNGIGTCLLLESMLRMKELDTPQAIAGWAATGFYLKNGWHIYRQYVVFQKRIKLPSRGE
jgi:GNAT superfamily N-acetyltransferase